MEEGGGCGAWRGWRADEGNDRGEIINEIFEMFVEPKLIQPTFILDYPIEICPLTKEHRKNPILVERFELFVNGL